LTSCVLSWLEDNVEVLIRGGRDSFEGWLVQSNTPGPIDFSVAAVQVEIIGACAVDVDQLTAHVQDLPLHDCDWWDVNVTGALHSAVIPIGRIISSQEVNDLTLILECARTVRDENLRVILIVQIQLWNAAVL
jgi:hypothetical protein